VRRDMDFIELIKKRYSVRGFQERPVSDELVLKVLEAARWAPSACNNQPWNFIVIRSTEFKLRLEAVYNRPWFLAAPVIIAACCDRNISWKRTDGKEYGDVDIAIALDHLTLAAAEMGLGTCWVGAFNYPEACRVLRLPDNIEPVAFTPLGYPSVEQSTKKRKELDQIVHWEHFGGSREDLK
jgi:nitroreductase